MQQYKILAQVLLMLSIIDFALAAPVVIQDHEVRVSAANTARDGPYTNNPLSGLGLVARWVTERGTGFLSSSPGSESMSTPAHGAPPAGVSPQIGPSPGWSPSPPFGSSLPPDLPSPSFGSWLPPDSHSGSESSWPSESGSWSSGSGFESVSQQSGSVGGLHPGQHRTSNPQDLLSTAESRPPSLGQIGHPPPPPSEPGLSITPPTRPPLPPGVEEVNKAAKVLMAISKQGLRPRTYGSGAADAAKEELVGTRH
jgi:hypothetical protein